MSLLLDEPPGGNCSRVGGDGDGQVERSGEGIRLTPLRNDDENRQNQHRRIFPEEFTAFDIQPPILGLDGFELSEEHDNKSNNNYSNNSLILASIRCDIIRQRLSF